ncbi:MAG TPA: hypothetical protein VLI90_07400, partial [Tepidisphaeraceae bacterium]|nr:hypothetical protein [Tepidisphaeraceae bacterium]
MLAPFVIAMALTVVLGAGPEETRTFELRAAPPPATAGMTHQLLTDPRDMRRGDAAVPLMRAALLFGNVRQEEVGKVYDARDGDPKRFDAMARPIVETMGNYVTLVADAACREHADWDAGSERGINALLPELNGMRELANMLDVIATYQIHQGQLEEALNSIRLQYELGRKVGQSRVLVSNLVALGIISLANDRLADVMNHADAPNLYWSLARLPRPMLRIDRAFEGERRMLIDTVPILAEARSRELSGDHWRDVYKQLSVLDDQSKSGKSTKQSNRFDLDEQLRPGGVGQAILATAQERYAQSHNIPAGEAAELDAVKVVAAYYYEQYQNVIDGMTRPINLPYPQLIPALDAWGKDAQRLMHEQPGNPFLHYVPSVNRAVARFA